MWLRIWDLSLCSPLIGELFSMQRLKVMHLGILFEVIITTNRKESAFIFFYGLVLIKPGSKIIVRRKRDSHRGASATPLFWLPIKRPGSPQTHS